MGEEILRSNQSWIIVQPKLTYSPLGKAFGKKSEKLVDDLKSLTISHKTDELKQSIVYFHKIISIWFLIG